MLRLGRGLKPRVSNQLAAVSAILLLVSFLMQTNNPGVTGGASPEWPEARAYDAVEPAPDPFPAVQTALPRGNKISLMIFH